MLKLAYGALFLAALVVGSQAAIRLASQNSQDYISDPFQAVLPKTPNGYISTDAEGQFELPLPVMAQKLAAHMQNLARTTIISPNQDLAQGPVTYRIRTLLMGYPDYVSMALRTDVAGKVTVKIFSRSRFGSSDFGVNKTRVQAVLAALR
ncbi:hypothetical protein GCM10007939_04030 [Amylibacter marinus]|uniref:DUF1499 domain-containing protein n=1 Tax=Amylibacter marinus TaxID=1475483 RepID=A0ABQ5VS44_9RHOB|nr:DUF1499 domain-containing protein [Amylibacter marinus]GLQ34120.1 hypothetical protein GCM10007939_04030 [Amylibacter marinus]